LLAWRRNSEHLEAQEKGKTTIFQKYRIRVASVIRDYDFATDNAG
jgi:heme-degrading monooxygenase HmoA